MVAEGTGGQVIVGLTPLVLQLEESYPSISAFSFVNDSHFLIIVSIDFRVFPDLIGCRSTVEFKLIVIIFSCTSSIMVAEGIRGQAPQCAKGGPLR